MLRTPKSTKAASSLPGPGPEGEGSEGSFHAVLHCLDERNDFPSLHSPPDPQALRKGTKAFVNFRDTTRVFASSLPFTGLPLLGRFGGRTVAGSGVVYRTLVCDRRCCPRRPRGLVSVVTASACTESPLIHQHSINQVQDANTRLRQSKARFVASQYL